jgi:hypothetical protein
VITTSAEPFGIDDKPARQSPSESDHACGSSEPVDGPRCLADLDIRIGKTEP